MLVVKVAAGAVDVGVVVAVVDATVVSGCARYVASRDDLCATMNMTKVVKYSRTNH